MTYERIVDHILNARRFGDLPGVAVSGRLLDALGRPQQGMRLIHIAGTNGKGSVSAFLSRILEEAGYRAGVFTSPHLVDFRERIRIGREMIPEEAVVRLGERLLSAESGVKPKMFDYCLAMAMLYFAEEHCDVVIAETGLGGRLDSTNALGVPEVTVITRIGYDHTEILGDTLEQIASEKAGIIKCGTKLITAPQETERVLQVILDAASVKGVTDIRAVHEEEIGREGLKDGLQTFSFQGYRHLQTQLLGVHQYENAAAAILAAEAFLGAEAEGMRQHVVRGIRNTVWEGRMQILSRKPFLLVDGAHNGSGAAALAKSLAYLFPGEKFHFIMGVMADKDYEKMLELLIPLALDFTAVTVDDKRSLSAGELAASLRKHNAEVKICTDLQERLSYLPSEEKTVVFGSLYFIGSILGTYFAK